MKTQLKEELEKQLSKLRNSNYSLIITVDGCNVENKNYVVDKLIDRIPPKYLKLVDKPQGKFQIKDYWVNQPANKCITIYDGSYMSNLMHKEAKKLREEVAFFETQMFKYGTFIIHIYVDDEKGKNIDKFFESDLGTEAINIHTCKKDKKAAYEEVLEDILYNSDFTEYIKAANSIQKTKEPKKYSMPEIPADINSWKFTSEEKYDAKLDELKKELRKLHKKFIDNDLAVNIVFQGIDAAGKSSTIRRLTTGMVPHMFNVYGFGAPSEEELSHHYLWRFWTKLPDKGEIVVFDRSWYERLTAERVLKITHNWGDGVQEIAEFEREMNQRGILTIKLWFDIDKDTQLERFNERKRNPLKQWKFSKSDMETRKLWDVYQNAFAYMLNNTEGWFIIDSRVKKEARINTLKVVIKEMKKFLKENK